MHKQIWVRTGISRVIIDDSVNCATTSSASVTRLGDLFDFGQLFKAFGTN